MFFWVHQVYVQLTWLRNRTIEYSNIWTYFPPEDIYILWYIVQYSYEMATTIIVCVYIINCSEKWFLSGARSTPWLPAPVKGLS